MKVAVLFLVFQCTSLAWAQTPCNAQQRDICLENMKQFELDEYKSVVPTYEDSELTLMCRYISAAHLTKHKVKPFFSFFLGQHAMVPEITAVLLFGEDVNSWKNIFVHEMEIGPKSLLYKLWRRLNPRFVSKNILLHVRFKRKLFCFGKQWVQEDGCLHRPVCRQLRSLRQVFLWNVRSFMEVHLRRQTTRSVLLNPFLYIGLYICAQKVLWYTSDKLAARKLNLLLSGTPE